MDVIKAIKAGKKVIAMCAPATEGQFGNDITMASIKNALDQSCIRIMKDTDIKTFTKEVRAEFQFLSYVPIVFLSAKEGTRVHTLMPEIIKVYNNSRRELKTSTLNNVIRDADDLNPAPSYKGRRLKIYYVVQVGIMPIRINFFVNDKGLVHFSYERYLENKLRENFDLEGTPIEIQFKNKGETGM